MEQGGWVGLQIIAGGRGMVARCGHARTRTHWHQRGPTPAPQALATIAILGHQVVSGCVCGAALWQEPHPEGICLQQTAALERQLPREEAEIMLHPDGLC